MIRSLFTGSLLLLPLACSGSSAPPRAPLVPPLATAPLTSDRPRSDGDVSPPRPMEELFPREPAETNAQSAPAAVAGSAAPVMRGSAAAPARPGLEPANLTRQPIAHDDPDFIFEHCPECSAKLEAYEAAVSATSGVPGVVPSFVPEMPDVGCPECTRLSLRNYEARRAERARGNAPSRGRAPRQQ